jgi:Phage P22-like portal protein
MAKKAEKIAHQTRIAVEKWREYFKPNIDLYHEMHTFVLGRQWDNDEEDMLVKNNKVPLQFNKLGTLINTLLGEQQQNTPQLEVVPLSDCDEETASIRQMIVKDTMLSTDAKSVYQIAAKQAFVGGFGAFLVDTDYVHAKSFDQGIIYRHFKDATRCYWDVGADHPNKIDGMRCGYISRMTRQKFRSIYGKDIEEKIKKDSGALSQSQEEIALSTENQSSENPFTWSDGNGITIIDDYVRKYTNDTLYKLSNGRILNQDEMDELIENSKSTNSHMREEKRLLEFLNEDSVDFDALETNTMPSEDIEESEEDIMTLYDDGEMVRIEDSKPCKRSTIIHRKIAGEYVLDESEFPSDDLPLLFVDQNSYYDKNGKQICRPFIIDAIDAQRYLNYLGTQSAYMLKISRYDQWIGSKKNVQSLDTQQAWKDPSTVKGLLHYDESPTGAKPEQVRPPELSRSLMEQYQRALDDMYTSTGLYPSRLGQVGNEVSGAAIDARTRQGSYSTYVAFNSINMAITAGGKIVNQMIPRVYDSERILNLMTPDKGRQNIVVNQQMDEYGEKIRNDIRKGSFDVILQAGPSYEGQKAQALESIAMALKANPTMFNLVADLYAENLPLLNTIELRNRLKTLVPPEILEAGKTGQMPQQAQQPNPENQMVMAEIQFKQQQIEIEKQKLQIKIKEAEAKTEQMAMEVEMKQLELAAQLEQQKLRYLAETDRTKSDNAIAHADNLAKILTHRAQGR